jgi:hypothetical protein
LKHKFSINIYTLVHKLAYCFFFSFRPNQPNPQIYNNTLNKNAPKKSDDGAGKNIGEKYEDFPAKHTKRFSIRLLMNHNFLFQKKQSGIKHFCSGIIISI